MRRVSTFESGNDRANLSEAMFETERLPPNHLVKLSRIRKLPRFVRKLVQRFFTRGYKYFIPTGLNQRTDAMKSEAGVIPTVLI